MTKAMIEAINISKVYPNGIKALEDVTFSVEKGESYSIIGPSGCGKTTLLFIFSGILKPTTGKVLIDGNEINNPPKNIALILQDFGLFPWKTVYENVCLGLKIRGIEKNRQKKIVEKLLKDMGLYEFKNSYPKELSGGMQQRVAIARALALNPEIMLMDEPFSSLDALTREKLQNFLLELQNKDNITTVLVTHNIEEAVFLGKKIVILSPRPGRVVKIIDNQGMGDIEYRNKKEFFEKCREVRKSISSAI